MWAQSIPSQKLIHFLHRTLSLLGISNSLAGQPDKWVRLEGWSRMVATEQVLATGQQLDTLCINTIRTLAIDGVQQANSGHPGAPMGLAPVSFCLWENFLRYAPADPTWLNRDRFVLSNGHASMLLYAMLYLAEAREGEDQR